MKKFFSVVLLLSMLILSACESNDKSSDINTSANSNNSQNSNSQVENIQAKENALKLIPADFSEALTIEMKRQEVLLTGCHADMDNATYKAFIETKGLYGTFCNKVKNELDGNQKELFEDYLAKEKQYNIAFDMFSHKALQQYVYTTGNASCSESYNITRTKTIMMYYYYNYLTNNEIDDENYQRVLDENFNSFFFFNKDLDIIKGKSIAELNNIDNEYSPWLKNIFKEESQPVFDDYKTSFNEFILAMQGFEKSIDESGKKIDNSIFYFSLNSAFIYNLYGKIKDMEYPEGMLEMFNLNLDKDEYISKWN